jgi:hypothetical protein
MSTNFDALAMQASNMARAYDDLWGYSIYAAGVISSTFGEQAKNALNALGTYQTAIKKLPGLRDRVLSGTYAYSQWVDYAKEIRGSIAYTLGDVTSWSWSGVLDSTLNQTYEDVVEQASTALKWGSAGLGVVAAIGLVFAILIYGPRR